MYGLANQTNGKNKKNGIELQNKFCNEFLFSKNVKNYFFEVIMSNT